MEAISILFHCNFLIGVLSSAVMTLGNLPQSPPEEIKAQPTEAVVILAESSATHEEPAESESEYESTENEEDEITEEYEESFEPEIRDVFYEGFDSSFKAYMDYRCITDTSSVQYEMQQQAYTDSRGFRRIGDDYCVALGTGFTDGCGERFAVYLDSGYSFTAIVSDVKSDVHTDSTNRYVPRGDNSGNVVEFIIDSDCADGSMLSSGNAGYYEDLSGNVVGIEPI